VGDGVQLAVGSAQYRFGIIVIRQRAIMGSAHFAYHSSEAGIFIGP
jgi:hypothetical protein